MAFNILVTGVGAIIGYGIVQSLRNSGLDVNITGMDIYPDAYGRFICDDFIQAIPACDEKYPQFIKDLIIERKIDLVMFGTEQEILRLLNAKDELGECSSKLVLNRPEIVNMSQDKWLTHQFLVENGLDAIPTEIEGGFDDIKEKFGLPFLLKPRCSYASKGIVRINDAEEFDFFRKKAGDQFMVQRIIGDNEHEFTSAVFGLGNGNFIGPITLRRKLSADGSTAKAVVVEVPQIKQLIKKYAEILKPVGPTNFQFRQDGEKWYLLEINPRISSSTSIRAAFGYNEARMCIEFFVNGQISGDVVIKKGTAVRYIADCINYL